MNNYKVFLNVGDHPIYNSLIKFPPEGVTYVNYSKGMRSAKNLKIYEKRKNIIRNIISKFTSNLRVSRMRLFNTDAELIHSSRGIIPLNQIPWVMDIEHAKSFFDDHKVLHSKRAKNIVRGFILSKYCKKIMPHCNMSYKSLISAFGGDVKGKMEKVYPAIEPRKFRVDYDAEKIRLLFVANKFFEKGGKEVLEAFKILNDKYDVELIVKCNVPPEFRKKDKNVKFINEILSYETLFEKIYSKSNIFIFPTYIDTFGFSLLEAMSVGLPIITNNIFAVPEIVENEKNGFLIDAKKYDWAGGNGLMRPDFLINPQKRISMYTQNKPEIVKQLVEKTSILIEESSLRKKMGEYGRQMVESGKFSIRERNKKLIEVYQQSLRY